MGLPNGIGQTQGVCPMGGLRIRAPAQAQQPTYLLSWAPGPGTAAQISIALSFRLLAIWSKNTGSALRAQAIRPDALRGCLCAEKLLLCVPDYLWAKIPGDCWLAWPASQLLEFSSKGNQPHTKTSFQHKDTFCVHLALSLGHVGPSPDFFAHVAGCRRPSQ